MATFKPNNLGFALVPNYVFQDSNLKIKDIGLLAYLLSIDLNDEPSVLKIIAAFEHDGKDSIRTSIFNLEKFGYLVREKKRWILNLKDIEEPFSFPNPSAKILIKFITDKQARTQYWSSEELLLLNKPLLELENMYDFSTVYSCFKYVIAHLPEKGIRDRVAYVIKSMKAGCKSLYYSSLSEDERLSLDPMYKTVQDFFNDLKIKVDDNNE